MWSLIDRITKWWAVNVLADKQIHILPGVSFSLSWNRGVAGSLLSSNSPWGFWLLTFFIICTIFIFLMYAFVQFHNHQGITYETLVLTGAMSNVIDRFWYGAVVDFIDCFIGAWHWPTFNVADALIVIGIMGICFIP